jgi:hypothetical protein
VVRRVRAKLAAKKPLDFAAIDRNFASNAA